MLEPTIHLVGNLADNPNLTVLDTGSYVCRFRIISSERRYDRREDRWVDGPSLSVDVTCWRKLAEHVATTLSKGDRAVVIGRLQQREYENAQGEKRRPYQVTADAVGPELAFRPAKITKAGRGTGPAARSDPQAAAPDGESAQFNRTLSVPSSSEPSAADPDDPAYADPPAGSWPGSDLDDRYEETGVDEFASTGRGAPAVSG